MMDNCGRRTGAEGTAETHFFWAKKIIVDGQHGEWVQGGDRAAQGQERRAKESSRGYDLRMFLRAPATALLGHVLKSCGQEKVSMRRGCSCWLLWDVILCECEIAWQKRCEVIASDPHGAINVRFFPTTDIAMKHPFDGILSLRGW